MRTTSRPSIVTCLGVVLLASPAFPVDGVIEINQAKAVAGGITPGDTPGFPVDLSLAGSYRLTGNLDLSSASPDTHAITIVATPITLDLNGFQIKGPGLAGVGKGIVDMIVGYVLIHDGLITKMGSDGINVYQGIVHDVVADGNGGGGIHLSKGIVSRAAVHANGAVGIEINEGSVVDSMAEFNQGDGIRIGMGVIQRCFSEHNQGHGYSVQSGTLMGSTSAANGSAAAEFYCNGKCAYGQNNFIYCSSGSVSSPCVQVENIALQAPAGSNLCNSVACP